MAKTPKRYVKPPKASKKVDKPKRSHVLLSPSSFARIRSPKRPRSIATPVDSFQSIMRRFKKKDTGPERTVRAMLVGLGARFHSNDPTLPGTPDIVLAY